MSSSAGSAATASGAQAPIDPATRMGTVTLTVTELERSSRFYETVLGLRAETEPDGSVALRAPGQTPLVRLWGDLSAPPLDRRAPGLFHLAILLPSRKELANALARLAEARWPLDGASDHLVSEALYLSDPGGNGIELYRDRPREEWPRRDGALQMATLPLDLEDVWRERDEGVVAAAPQGQGADAVPAGVPVGTTMGHVHLQVGDLPSAEEFYVGVLGFEVVVRAYPGALFVSAGGYHHHLGLNTWHSAGSKSATPGALGLREFEIVLPNDQALEKALERIRTGGLPLDERDGGHSVTDPFGNRILLRSG